MPLPRLQRPDAFAQNGDIYVVNPDGTGVTDLTNNPAGLDKEPARSTDGTKVAFASDRDGNFEIYTMDSDGSNQASPVPGLVS
jgi:Tol biopolymer transport system component